MDLENWRWFHNFGLHSFLIVITHLLNKILQHIKQVLGSNIWKTILFFDIFGLGSLLTIVFSFVSFALALMVKAADGETFNYA